MRAFFAVDVPPMATLGDLLERLRAAGEDLKAVDPQNLHLTLKFLGDVPESRVPALVAALGEVARAGGTFTVTLRGTGVFPRWSNPRVLWVGVEDGGGLGRLAADLEARCLPLGFPPEGRSFSPHLTLARVREGRVERALEVLEGAQGQVHGSFAVDSVVLKRSTLGRQGPRYEDVARASLAHGLG